MLDRAVRQARLRLIPVPHDAVQSLASVVSGLVVSGSIISAMRTRASACGGVFAAQPVSGVRCRVSATFPSPRRSSGTVRRAARRQ